ncbi:DUF6942 family protein [Thalassotalea sp. PS06]|uniref:DUF6942 family protein n=1 Tax=Thalassotalea sp. PS06 TaxID=2594005 RepID=UPI00116589F5|nr:hypothetical protein [Thalassotalea sp. PS06]QDP02107.1 hypothetical protein FNC98_12620 [Thalassotalea sp. PS06]
MLKEYGLGQAGAQFQVYIANKPDYQELPELDHTQALHDGDIAAIGLACGNGWRKVFNVYAKLVYALAGINNTVNCFANVTSDYSSWQAYRDQQLLQAKSQTSLLFSKPVFSKPDFEQFPDSSIRIVMGRTYAKTLAIPNLVWLNEEFAISERQNLIVCPYFDYRQLSNIKIIYLCELISNLKQ